MTRVCMDCKAEMGEKCPVCGSERVSVCWRWIDLSGVLTRLQIFICRGLDCSYLRKNKRRCEFLAGEGGETHGLCKPCHDIRRKELDVRAEAVTL